ncbi:MAG: tRNA (adenosine(37)-N6)-threonylcarbamoyltransferase complex ATPase subunit type 1 TsaE [Clostridia bacterium]|nr:tRNA (adenosine(37)-N6)-threonylcarbamoyltransferase complex ATPase subunit type 1 TsaE [Clostridia bacterium]
MEYISNSEQQTIKIAYDIAGKLNNTDTVVLTGELGAGKTKFMYGIATFFNIQDKISSPTFTIVNEYNLDETINGINTIFHFDVYRIENSIDFIDSIGLEYFSNGLCILEWGENIKEILPKNTIFINILKDDTDENKRIIQVQRGEK